MSILYWKILIFVAVSLIIFIISRRSLALPGYHGFFRFFVFEGTLLNIVYNIEKWFTDPFSIFQIISWVCLVFSVYLVGSSTFLLRKYGSAVDSASGPEFRFENTRELVTSGVYRYIRHPMYASLLFLCWGVFFKRIDPVTVLTTLFVTLMVLLTAKAEERENIHRFGERYTAYMRTTKMFVPFFI